MAGPGVPVNTPVWTAHGAEESLCTVLPGYSSFTKIDSPLWSGFRPWDIAGQTGLPFSERLLSGAIPSPRMGDFELLPPRELICLQE